MPDEPAKYTIADDYDPDGDMRAGADPMSEYLTYLADVGRRYGIYCSKTSSGISPGCATSANPVFTRIAIISSRV